MKNRSDELDEILAELRKQHQQSKTPPFLEARLRAAARSGRTALLARRWGLALAASLIAGLVIWRTNQPSQLPGLQARRPEPARQTDVAAARPADPVAIGAKAAPKIRVRAAARTQPREFVTEFINLPGSETLPAPLQTSILRVHVLKGELRQFGFEVPPPAAAELIRADFVVGDDGLARAVRLVQ